jgi:hypothetical protein
MEVVLGLFVTIIVLVLIGILVYQYGQMADYIHFVCPYCNTVFKISKLDFITAFKTGVPDERIVTCPHCNHRDRMHMIKDN